MLAWRRTAAGYVAAPGLLLAVGLDGAVFALAALVDGWFVGVPAAGLVVGMHTAVATLGLALPAWLLCHTIA